MERLEKTFEVKVPVRTAYNQWTQFEEFPRFMDGIEEVRQLDDTHQHWRASVGGKVKEWDAEITEQVPDQVIAWRSTSGPHNGGQVRFEPMGGDSTRIHLTMEYEPETAVERPATPLGSCRARSRRRSRTSRSSSSSAGVRPAHGAARCTVGARRAGRPSGRATVL